MRNSHIQVKYELGKTTVNRCSQVPKLGMERKKRGTKTLILHSAKTEAIQKLKITEIIHNEVKE
jgi:hypothetical protein